MATTEQEIKMANSDDRNNNDEDDTVPIPRSKSFTGITDSVSTHSAKPKVQTTGIDVQLEYIWTVVWAYLAAWTFGAPVVFPPETNMWSGPGLFFILCITFYEMQTGAVTNPAYWVKDYFADEISERKVRKAPLDRMLLMGAVDLIGHATGFWLYLKTLELMGEKAALEIAAQPPNFKCGWIWAIIVEAVVTGATQLSSTIPEALGITGRLGNLVASFLGVYIVMVWGMPYTGAVMNPASSLAATFISGRFVAKQRLDPFIIFRVILVFVSAPFAGAVVAGIIEGGLERDRIKREKLQKLE